MKIFLLGFMGSGKSTLGREIARLLYLHFCDLDDLVEASEGISINEIFRTLGEEYFRKAEQKQLKTQLSGQNFVLATGGGCPCYYDNMDLMNDAGITIYLRLTPVALYDRLKGETESRPLLHTSHESGLMEYIQGKLAERESFYLKSKLVITESDQDAENIASIIRSYNSRGLFSS